MSKFDDQVVPSKCRMVPLAPAAQMSLSSTTLLLHTELRLAWVAVIEGNHIVPSQWTTVPKSPTAQTSSFLLSHTPQSWCALPVSEEDQTDPSQWTVTAEGPW